MSELLPEEIMPAVPDNRINQIAEAFLNGYSIDSVRKEFTEEEIYAAIRKDPSILDHPFGHISTEEII